MTFHFQCICIVGKEHIGEKDQPEQYREEKNGIPLPEIKNDQKDTENSH